MSARSYTTIWCDAVEEGHACGEYVDVGGVTAVTVRCAAKEFGWSVALPGGVDLCPKHKSLRDDS